VAVHVLNESIPTENVRPKDSET